MDKNMSTRIIDTIEDHVTVVNFLNELCLYIEGKGNLPYIHGTNDIMLSEYMTEIAEFVHTKR